jgi:hypothetical protein
MPKTDPETNDILLGIGDLIVNTEKNTIGVLLGRHRLLRSTAAIQPDRAFEWAWTIKWSDEKEKSKNSANCWVKFYACSEDSILSEIKKGFVEHYSVK